MKFWRIADVIKYLEISKPGFWLLRKNDPTFPLPIIVQSRKLFDPKAVQAWWDSKARPIARKNAKRLASVKP